MKAFAELSEAEPERDGVLGHLQQGKRIALSYIWY